MFVFGRENPGRESTFAQGSRLRASRFGGRRKVDRFRSFDPSAPSTNSFGQAQDRSGQVRSGQVRAGLVNEDFGLGRPASGEIFSLSA